MWECKKCGKCCREIKVELPTEDKDVRKLLFGYRCPYLGEDNLCTIYEWRFTFCRDYKCEVKDAI